MSVALVRNPGDGPRFEYYDFGIEQVISTDETDGVLTATRFVMRPSGAPPLHAHSREDEAWVVLSGEVRFWVGGTTLDECDVHVAEPGALVFSPRLVPHTLQPVTSTAEILQLNSPGAIEGYFKGIGPAGERADADNLDFLESYGVRVFAAPPPA
ncbi:MULTISPECIES: cupin domain-containing protein [Actinomadura]|uniref:cupin domain-containing protein n=1 Tax=Actinomadura TaxID=1988 RepID=UPI00047CC678|nr:MULTISPECIES: cupin domain-containing protein [Actinomadura]RSN44425.1 cupin domain-containing protein [Actinomadura sp. WAC 06369]